MDDYFMIEVEKKVDHNEGSKSSTASKGQKLLTKKVIEYCYEPEMEETYRSSMLNAFNKTLDEGNFTFVIVGLSCLFCWLVVRNGRLLSEGFGILLFETRDMDKGMFRFPLLRVKKQPKFPLYI